MSEQFRLRESDDYRVYFINHRNTKVGGSVELDEDGFASIYINARRSLDQQHKTFDHEVRHLINGDLHNEDPIEVVEARAAAREIIPQRSEPVLEDAQAEPAIQAPAPDPFKAGLPLSHDIRGDAFLAFGFPKEDPQWPEIIWAMLVTGISLPKDDPRGRLSFFFTGLRVRQGRIYPSTRKTDLAYRLKRRRILEYR